MGIVSKLITASQGTGKIKLITGYTFKMKGMLITLVI